MASEPPIQSTESGMTSDNYPPNDGQSAEAEEKPRETKAPAADAGDPDDRTATLEAEVATLNDRILRLAAELENTRRRSDREKADASRYAIASFARDLLNVADTFERALDSAPGDDAETNAEAISGFVTGVKMTERALAAALERHGVKKVDPKGEKFDPNLHQAVAQAPAPGVPAGHVAQTAQVGFMIGDRVLRAAMVIVSTGEAPPPESGAHIDTSA
ncbi:MAG: nucleotide exchange factor GrpE [Parvularculaceae bacterium]|nr:nucleotide exchange factor GrpE [Parvularculaceae bacterium]